MTNLLNPYPVTRKWPAHYPDRLQLYSLPTPNGVKVSIMLEEIALPYEAHRVEFSTNDQLTPEFISLSANNKIPAILDPNGPEGEPIGLFESGAILIYLAEKSGQLLPSKPTLRYECLQWLMWQMGGLGPMLGQLGYFHKFAGNEITDPRPLKRYVDESKRLLRVLDIQLQEKKWIVSDDYTIADIAVFPWVNTLVSFYEASELVEFDRYKNVQRALGLFLARQAVQRGLEVPKAEA